MKYGRKMIAALLMLVMLLSAVQAFGEERIWKRDDTGETVTEIQTRLIGLGYLEGEPTGIFDEKTEKALIAFQRANGLLVTGMADGKTLEVLRSENAAAYEAPEEKWAWETEEEAMVDAGWVYSTAMPAPNLYMSKNTFVAGGSYLMGSQPPFSTDEYTMIGENGFVTAAYSPLSTFAADVDTSSYAQLRRRILDGQEIPAGSVRIEEMLNYFSYDYRKPEGNEPFGVTMELAACPWNEKTMLLQIGLQAAAVEEENRTPYNLVFLIDTSGSMEGADRLDLVKRAFLLLLEELKPTDTVSVVTYASRESVLLEGVPASEKTRIMEAISDLNAYGSTNGSAGLIRAYEIAEKYAQEGGVSRILLATDGDLNVGVTSEAELARMVTEKKEKGVSLTCLGFGMGNYKDNKMEALADYGNGNCHYIDTIYEARKALITEGGGTFQTVAKDVKLQLDFNPARVKGYRLIGYEDRLMAAEDFADDTKDGGEIGSGHRVTALYEIVPADSDFDFGGVESKYSAPAAQENDEWLTLSIRAKAPDGDESTLYTYPLSAEAADELSDNMKFAAAVAETGMLLRESEWSGDATWSSALELLRSCGSVSGDPYKEEFLYMVTLLERK